MKLNAEKMLGDQLGLVVQEDIDFLAAASASYPLAKKSIGLLVQEAPVTSAVMAATTVSLLLLAKHYDMSVIPHILSEKDYKKYLAIQRNKKKGSNNRPINKITGHHPGWANKKTEAAIASDFTAGKSYTGEKEERKKIPLITHALLTAASFMTALDRTKSLRGGLAGAGAALGFIGLRHITTPEGGLHGAVNTAWQAAEFSAITSLMGSSMMRGGFLHKSVGKPSQRWFSTTGYGKLLPKIESSIPGKVIPGVHGTKTLHGGVRGIDKWMRGNVESVEYIKNMPKEDWFRELPWPFKALTWGTSKVAQPTSEAAARLSSEYGGIFTKYLKGIIKGPRGPFEVTSGMFDVFSRAIKAVEEPRKEIVNIFRIALGHKGNAVAQFGPNILSKETAKIEKLLSSFRSTKVYRGMKGFVGGRKYFEGIFGSPNVGELVQKYGNIKNIPIKSYAKANLQDIYYGAAPALAIASPFIAFGVARHGVNKVFGRDDEGELGKHGSNNKPIDKITGHHPGRMNKATEAAIDSDFTAGESLTQVKNALELMGTVTGFGKKSIMQGLKKWGSLSVDDILAAISKSGTKVKFADTSKGFAGKFIGLSGGEIQGGYSYFKNTLTLNKALLEGGDASLKTVIAHEVLEKVYIEKALGTNRFKGVLKMLRGGAQKNIRPDFTESIKSATGLLEKGKKLSELIQWWSHADVGVVTGELRFGREVGLKTGLDIVGRIGSSSAISVGTLVSPKNIRFRRGYGNILDIASMGRKNKILRATTERLSKAESTNVMKGISSIAQSNARKAMGNTAGLTNKVLHERSVNHTIINQAEKTKHLFKM